jgi:hypothetical protein|nr:MAG TPA: hypothetical protein [Caudoviricetes sp.]
MKDKLETGAMLNPKCQECSKKDTCNNKTLCAYLIPGKIGVVIKKDIQNLISKSLNIEINSGTDYSKNCYMKRGSK